ncbi:tetratricopeptide repeat protein [Aeromonas veronii]|uniref:tetratricopeptide repeat protein n=1 Tax=Aeromonas veronii TaxID=654 RepID=UPI001F2DA606|nr:tetratricopeptide repeat protein [Aeromonas veronii]MCF5858392.1 tetratricopeptide repeat protein [Aeromonas veronii]
MSVINQMLKDLDRRQQGSEGATVYIAPARQQGWWMLLLTLICGLALGILGWRTWIYWQQTQPVTAASEVVTPDVVARAAAPVSQPEPVEVTAALPLPSQDEVNDEVGEHDSGDTTDGAPFDASSDVDETEPTDEELQPELYAELAAEQQAVASAPRKPSVLKIETVELSAKELAALAERKATTAMAKGSLRDAQDNYYQVLAHDPYNQGAREQLAGLLYGEGRLTEARQLLEEGIRLDPQQADFRLLLARLAISEGQQQQALGWLSGYQPDLASNMDYYATWAGLTQELGQNADAAALYVKLLRQQPDQGRWWLGLGVAEDGQGHSQRALDAYRNALLHGNLGEASTNWLEQRIGQLTP